jgi:hypothetical protein
MARAASPRSTPLFLHDAAASPHAPDPDRQHDHTYLDSSGIVFLSSSIVAEYVLRSPENNLLQRQGRQVSNGYSLGITLFDIERKRITRHSEIPVPGKFIRVFRSAQGGLLICTRSWVESLSLTLEVLHQVPISPRYGDSDVSSDTDIDGAHLYLTGESADPCPQLVQVLDAVSLHTQASWCFQSAASTAFFRDTALQYDPGNGADLRVFLNGRQQTTLKPPSLFATTQAIPLSASSFLLTNGSALLGYRLDAGLAYFAPVAKHALIVSPIHCTAAGSQCAMALAVPKSDPLVLSLQTTYSRVDIAAIDAASGKLRTRFSIRALFPRPSRIAIGDFADLRVVLAPQGQRVAVWHGSTWAVYATQ